MLFRTVLGVLLISLACSSNSRSSFSDQDRSAIATTLEEQAQAWNRHDLAAFMEYYQRSPELLFTSGGKIRNGWQATMDSFDKRYRQSDRSGMGHLTFKLEKIIPLGINAALVLGHFKLVDTPQASEGVFTLTLQRRDLEAPWRITSDHTSVLDGENVPSAKNTSGQNPDQ